MSTEDRQTELPLAGPTPDVSWPDSLLRLGTCSWTAKGWERVFYETKTRTEFIAEYARRYSTVEIDATFYAAPAEKTVDGWRERVTPGFVFSAKTPRSITHDQVLDGAEREMAAFLLTMSRLEDHLGPILLQFPYFSKKSGLDAEKFLARLRPFLQILPVGEMRFAVEVRNKAWITPALCEALGERGVALTLIDHPWMIGPDALCENEGNFTAPFTYIRWLGDRHGIEKITKVWDKTVVDKRERLEMWARYIQGILDLKIQVYGYVNNHYSGYAPADIAVLQELLSPPS